MRNSILFAIIGLMLVTVLTGCMSPDSVTWGLNTPTSKFLLPEQWHASEDALMVYEAVLTEFAFLAGCDSINTSRVHLDWPQNAASIILLGACGPEVRDEVGRLMSDENARQKLRAIVMALDQSYEHLLSTLPNVRGSDDPMIAEVIGRFAYSSVYLGQSRIDNAKQDHQTYERLRTEESLRAALNSAIGAEHHLANAGHFIEALNKVLPTCETDYSLSMERVKMNRDSLEELVIKPSSTPRIERLESVIDDVLSREIGPAADILQLNIQYTINLIEVSGETHFPTAREANYILNQILTESDRPGISEFIETQLTTTEDESLWRNSIRSATRVLAMDRMDWNRTVDYCNNGGNL